MGSKRNTSKGQGSTGGSLRQSLANWEEAELKKFYSAFHKYGTTWSKVCRSVNSTKTQEDCEALYRQHQTFLNIPYNQALESAFLAMVKDARNILKTGESDTVSNEGPGSVVSAGTSTPRAAPQKGKRSARPRPNRGGGVTPVSKQPTASTPGSTSGKYKVPVGKTIFGAGTTVGETAGPAKKRTRRLILDDDLPVSAPPPIQQVSNHKLYDRWRRGAHDDVGEGVDALLSLASIAHASSSCATDSQPHQPDEEVTINTQPTNDADTTSAKAATPTRDDHPGLFLKGSATPSRRPTFILSSPCSYQQSSPLGRSRLRGDDSLPAKVAMKEVERLRLGMQTPTREQQQLAIFPVGEQIPGACLEREISLLGGLKSSVQVGQLEYLEYPHPLARSYLEASPRKTLSAHEPPRSTTVFGKRAHAPVSGADQQVRSLRARDSLTSFLSSMPSISSDPLAALSYGLAPLADLHLQPENLNSFPAQLPGASPTPQPRLRRRKPLPEKFPPVQNSLRLLFSTWGPYHGFSTPGAQGQVSPPLGETGEPMSLSEGVLRRALTPKFRRWAMYEFHYSALDRPWFMKNELQDFMNHLGIGSINCLTRAEWSLLRGALGRPRRLSLSFLKEERMRLEAYRDTVRRKYEEVGPGMEVPADMPRPLRVSQQVTARHPITRHLHDGFILTTKASKYRVQFIKGELGTEMVRDIDVMPVDPAENLPLGLMMMSPCLLNGRLTSGPEVSLRRKSSSAPARGPAAGRAQQEARALAQAALQEGMPPGGEAETHLLRALAAILDRKEFLLACLKEMHSDAEGGKILEGVAGPQAEEFKQHYNQVFHELHEVNQHLQALMQKLNVPSDPQGLPASQNQLGASIAADVAVEPAIVPAPGGPMGPPTSIPQPPCAEVDQLVKDALEEARSVVEQHRTGGPKGQGSGPLLVSEPRRVPLSGPSPEVPGVSPDSQLGSAVEGNAASVEEMEAEGAGVVTPGENESVAGGKCSSAGGYGGGEQEGASRLSAEPFPCVGTSGSQSEVSQEQEWLGQLITGCVGVLFTVQKCTSGNMEGHLVEKALDKAVDSVAPKAAKNTAVFKDILESINSLKFQLARA